MNKYCFIFSGIVLSAILNGCTNSKSGTAKSDKNVNAPYLLKINGKPVSVSEFQYVYNKNNANTPEAYSNKSIRDYLELYIKFRLKVYEAEQLGMDTLRSFKEELNGYKKQLASPYLTEKSVTENLIKEAYQRMLEEVKASHILIMVSPDAAPKDTLAAYNKMMEVRKKALEGVPFESLARQYSQDPSAATNQGNLGYFSALQMIYPFEDAAYKTPVGSISMPVRTKFGYHLIKVHDKRKAKGELKVAHIMARYSTGGLASDSLAALKKINELYGRLINGEDWNTVCSEFSDDFNSRNKGGELPSFTTGNMIPSFEEGAFKLENPGDIGKPIQTPYGFHIIKLLDRKPIPSFEVLEPSIRNRVQKDSRSDLGKTFFIRKLKVENNFQENLKAVEYVMNLADSTLPAAIFKYNPKAKEVEQKLFVIGEKSYLVKHFLQYVTEKQKLKAGITPKAYMAQFYKDYVEESLLAYEENNLEKKYDDYKMLVKEYRDGILLFSLMDQKVWSKAIEDTLGLKKFHLENNDKYMWQTRVSATIFNCKNSAIASEIKFKLSSEWFDVLYEAPLEFSFKKNGIEIETEFKKPVDEIKNILSRDKSYVAKIMISSEPGELPDVYEKRVNSLKKYLKNQGVDSTKIMYINSGLIKSAGVKGKNNSAPYKAKVSFVSQSLKTLEKNYNQKEALSVQIKDGLFQKGDDSILDNVNWNIGISNLEKNQRYYLIQIKKVLPPQPKSFEEARGQIISDYQTYLEKDWIETLRKKYRVEINESELAKLIK